MIIVFLLSAVMTICALLLCAGAFVKWMPMLPLGTARIVISGSCAVAIIYMMLPILKDMFSTIICSVKCCSEKRNKRLF